MITKLAAGLALAAAAPIVAQTDYRPVAPATQSLHFPTGTQLTLQTRTPLDGKRARPGDRVELVVAVPLEYRGQIVIPAGARAEGVIGLTEGNSIFGKAGTLQLRLKSVDTPYGPVRLTGDMARSDKGQGVLAIGGALFVAWPMMLIHGGDAKVPAGAIVTAQLLDDLRFAVVPGAGSAQQARAAPAPALLAAQ